MSLERAFAAVLELARPATEFGHHEFQDGTKVYGYWPTKPGENALNERGEAAWLRHEFFSPLAPDELSSLKRMVERPLPDSLTAWLTNCSNGLSLYAGEIEMYGLQRRVDRTDLVPHTFDLATLWRELTPSDAEEHIFVFGSWGDVQPLYVDERDGTVHAATTSSSEPIRSWESIRAMLVDEMRRVAPIFGLDGRRLDP